MVVKNGKVILLVYRLTDSQGLRLEQRLSDDPLAYLHGYQPLLGGLDEKLEGLHVGESVELAVPADCLDLDRELAPGSARLEACVLDVRDATVTEIEQRCVIHFPVTYPWARPSRGGFWGDLRAEHE
ncbi:MAG: hypothetical protein KC561_09655 [Myxococcales bacterium]|nr:hypothetical protein [Myxococcales bacterium]